MRGGPCTAQAASAIVCRNGAADPSQPVYVLEVGAGHGKLTHLLLYHLNDMREAWPPGVEVPFQIIMTDFTQNNVDFWLKHEPLKAHVESGLLDMAVFDAVYDCSLRLVHGKKTLNPTNLANPVIAITNYIFDTLPHDAFQVRGGALHQASVRTSTASASEEAQRKVQQVLGKAAAEGRPVPGTAVPVEAGMIKRLGCEWSYQEVDVETLPEPYAGDPALASVLQWYQGEVEEASVLVPIGGLALLRNLLTLSKGRCMLLLGDKAYSKLSELEGVRDPHIALHGSFSLMVNLHAVDLYAQAKGGFSLMTPYIDGFKCAAVVFGESPEGLVETRLAWEDVMVDFGPENFSCVQRCIKDETASPSLATALAVIRAAQWDSDVFYKFKATILANSSSSSVPDKLKSDLYEDVKRISATYYPLQSSKDISFELSRVLMGLGRYAEAVEGFQRSMAQCGEHHVTWYNIALCQFHMGAFPAAKELFTKSLKQSGGRYENAKLWLDKTEEKLAAVEGGKVEVAPEGGEAAAE